MKLCNGGTGEWGLAPRPERGRGGGQRGPRALHAAARGRTGDRRRRRSSWWSPCWDEPFVAGAVDDALFVADLLAGGSGPARPSSSWDDRETPAASRRCAASNGLCCRAQQLDVAVRHDRAAMAPAQPAGPPTWLVRKLRNSDRQAAVSRGRRRRPGGEGTRPPTLESVESDWFRWWLDSADRPNVACCCWTREQKMTTRRLGLCATRAGGRPRRVSKLALGRATCPASETRPEANLAGNRVPAPRRASCSARLRVNESASRASSAGVAERVPLLTVTMTWR